MLNGRIVYHFFIVPCLLATESHSAANAGLDLQPSCLGLLNARITGLSIIPHFLCKFKHFLK